MASKAGYTDQGQGQELWNQFFITHLLMSPLYGVTSSYKVSFILQFS